MFKPPIDPQIFDSRIAAADRQIALVTEEKRTHSLKLASDPDDARVHDLIGSCDAEIATHQATKQRLIEAQRLAIDRNTDAARVAYLESLKAECTRVDELGEELTNVSLEILDALAPLGELLERYERASNERGVIAYGVFRAGSPKGRSRWDGFRDAASLRHGPMSVAIATALSRAKLGQVGPALPGLSIPIPPSSGRSLDKGWRDESKSLHELVREGHAKAQAGVSLSLAEALVRAEQRINEGV